MRWTQTFIPTMKETPEGAEIPSHVLMLRAGLIHQVMAGAYTYLPLACGRCARRNGSFATRWTPPGRRAADVGPDADLPLGADGRVEAFGDVLIQFAVRRQNRKVQMALGPRTKR